MSNHIKRTHEELYDKCSEKFKCTYIGCQLQFPKYSQLKVHRRRHFGEKTYKCSDEYPDCKWTFFTNGELKNHQNSAHKEEKKFVCDWDGCGERFKTPRYLSTSFNFYLILSKNFSLHLLKDFININIRVKCHSSANGRVVINSFHKYLD